ncbi:collagen-like triple helix repeat-containing protein [Hoylesella timonensis]|uniref:collagen-like triple helix repeat-containing protein n=1 Tax=Hoylesella timonensis TaxID=386414 RepID=UPI000563F444|nr:collagen-like protein [Hoylesella timonensis]
MNKVLARSIITITAVNDGKDGQTPHLHIAYANSPDGKVDFSTDDSKDRAYIGQYVSYTDEPDSTDAGKYTWSLIKGKDAVVYRLELSSSQVSVSKYDQQNPEFIEIRAFRMESDKIVQLDNAKAQIEVLRDGQPISSYSLTYNKDDKKWVLSLHTGYVRFYYINLYIDGKKVDSKSVVFVYDGKNGEPGKPGKPGEPGKPGNNGEDAVVFRLIPKIEKAVVHGTKRETAKVVLFLKYMITRKEGEKHYLELGRLDTFGLSLTIEPSWASFEVKWEDGKPYWVTEATYDYADCFDATPFFRVCLMQGGKVLDARTIGLQYEVESNFDFGNKVDGLDGKIDGIAGKVSTLDGRVSVFETTIDQFRTEVKDKVSRTELKQTAESFSLTVANGTRPNLLWGSDFDLDGVDTTNKRAIQKHLGVELAEIGFSEWFEYLKGGGVAGADAIHIKNVYKSNGWIKWTNVAWKAVPLKPHTKYTISVWMKFKSYGESGCFYVDCASDDNRYNFGGYLHSDGNYTKSDIDKWKRMCYVFDSGDSSQMKHLFLACLADEREGAQCELWLCHPKLEEGDTATPWCAYDGTVEALLASGFSFKDREFKATADHFKVQNNRGEWTFLVDENGKLNAKLIDATEIYGMKIAQPFEAYASKEEIKNGKSLSWVLENWSQDYGFFGGGVRMNGVTSNIFNNTGGTVSFWLPLITPFKFCQVDIPNNVMLRAVAIYRTQWDGCRWYLLCPWEDNGSGGVRLKAFNG